MSSYHRGSFIGDLSILFTAAYQASFPFVVSLSPKEIWDISKQCYSYLKFVLDAFKRGETVKIEHDSNGNIVIITKGDNNTNNIYIHPEALKLASLAFGDYQDLVNNISVQDMELIKLP